MPLFDELLSTNKMEDPEERKAEELARSKNKAGKVKAKETSVTASTYNRTMILVGTIVGLAILALVAYVVYLGVMSFIPPGG